MEFEPGARLVEKPDGPIDSNEPRETNSPTLTGREKTRRLRCQPTKAETIERGLYPRVLATEQHDGGMEILPYIQPELEGVLIADEVNEAVPTAEIGEDIAAGIPHTARRRTKKPREQAKKARLAASVRTPQQERVASIELPVDRLKQDTTTAPASKTHRLKRARPVPGVGRVHAEGHPPAKARDQADATIAYWSAHKSFRQTALSRDRLWQSGSADNRD